MIVVTVGTPGKPRIKPGGIIPSRETSDIADMLGQVTNIGKKAEKVMNNLQKTTDTLADKKFNQDVRRSANSLGNILDSMDKGDGYAARLLHDPKEADHLSRTVENLEHTTAELNRTVAGFNQVLARVQKGPGFAHEVIYGKSGSKTLEHFGDAAEEVALTLRGIRKGNGVAKSLIYGDDKSQQLMSNLNAMSGDLRHIVADARAGKGTVGALLVDPSVYEDIKMLLGNVQRNQVLRALVRYSIKRDEKQGPKVEVTDPDSKAGGSASGASSQGSSSAGGSTSAGGGAAPARGPGATPP
jgi:phospholipid/cholesterol/gamma-HCH transport system substrate-binding protein